MEKQERELLIDTCDLLREMAEIQITTYRQMCALSNAVQTKLPDLKEEYDKARMDALFANAASIKVTKMIGEIEDVLTRLKTSR